MVRCFVLRTCTSSRTDFYVHFLKCFTCFYLLSYGTTVTRLLLVVPYEGAIVPFWLHDTKIVALTRRISTRNRFFMSCLLLGVITTAWWYFLYLPASVDMQHSMHENLLLKKQITAYEKILQKKRCDQSSFALNYEYQKLTAQHQCVQESVDFMFMKLKELGLTCKGLHPTGTKKEQVVHKEYFNLSVNGSFKKIITFLSHLHQSDCCVSFSSIALQRDKRRRVALQATIRLINIA